MDYKTREFIAACDKIHNGKYDYSKTTYTTAREYVTITCPVHGDFSMTAYCHKQKRGCAECSKLSASKKKTWTTEKFIKHCQKVHNGKYDYLNTIYIKDSKKVIITCPIHGDFEQSANSHKQGQGCPACGQQKRENGRTSNTQEFIKKAQLVHGDKYDYSKTEYTKARDQVTIICLRHGSFDQIAYYHLNGSGCKRCKQSKGEERIESYLILNRIDYISEWAPVLSVSTKQPYKYDFYLENHNMVIEYDGIQHFTPIKFTEDMDPDKSFKELKERDRIKEEICDAAGIKMIRIPYTHIDKIYDILDDLF